MGTKVSDLLDLLHKFMLGVLKIREITFTCLTGTFIESEVSHLLGLMHVKSMWSFELAAPGVTMYKL